MSSSGGSAKVIIISLSANLGIAVSKFIGAFISGSAALMAEGIHSLVDCLNQFLLLVGNKKSQRPATAQHPLGYGREAFFWSFVVAVLLFSGGGLFAIYEGVHKLSDHEQLQNPWVGLAILIVSCILEAVSLRACLKEVAQQNPYGSLWQWFCKSTSSELLVIFVEDLAAMAGLTLAAVTLSLAWATGEPFWDALGSILIGIVLVVVAVLLAIETKSLLIGEAPSTDYRTFIEERVRIHISGGKVFNLVALQIGAHEVMIACKVFLGAESSATKLVEGINQVERDVKAKFPEIRWQFFEPDTSD